MTGPADGSWVFRIQSKVMSHACLQVSFTRHQSHSLTSANIISPPSCLQLKWGVRNHWQWVQPLAERLSSLHCTDIMYCTHSEPSDRAARMTSPVTRPSAPWSPTWDKIACVCVRTHTQTARAQILTVWHQTRVDYFLQSLIKMGTFTLQSAGWSGGGFLHLRGWTWLALEP